MKSRISAVFGIAALCGISAFVWTGCSEDKPAPKPNVTTGAACELKDPLEPPINCGPPDEGASKCSSTNNVASCPANECMATVDQSGPTTNLRMGRIRLWAPDALLALTPIAIDPNVNPTCANGGAESFTWLIQVDSAKKEIKTGGARASTDNGKTFGFLDESVDASKLNDICPGFLSAAEVTAGVPVDLRPVTKPYTETNGALTTEKIDLVNVPIFDSSGLPIILPLRSAQIKDMTIKGSCVGKFEKDYWCDGTTLGWTTGGAIVAKMTADEADRVPVKSAGCQSLCAILVNDSTKTDGKRCKKGSDGKVPEIGTHCSKEGGTCKDSFLLSATFGAYGVNITTVATPGDAGGDTGGDDTGGGDTGGGDTGSVSDAADGG